MEFQVFIIAFKDADKRLIDRMLQNYGIHALFFKHIDILGLLYLIGHIEYLVFMFFFGRFQIILQRQIFILQVFIKDIGLHLFFELFILHHTVFNKRIDVIPVFFVIFTVGFTHTGKLVRHFLRNIIRNLLDKTVILQSGTGYVQRKVRTVDHTF